MKISTRKIRDALREIRRGSLDSTGLILTLMAARWLRRVRKHRIDLLPRTRAAFMRLGVYPIIDHYYEPLISRNILDPEYRLTRDLIGIDWREESQWALLQQFEWDSELKTLPLHRHHVQDGEFYLLNNYFGPGDADVYYSLIRLLKPKRILEVGSGHSTRLAALALARNAEESDVDEQGQMICVEPYRHPDWFPALGVQHIAQPIEEAKTGVLQELEAGDFLFIDSSHMVRPQGDVLFLIQEVLPALPTGVYIHVHDIFSPLDYPNEWLLDRMNFWNEQYLLEAFLTFNPNFEIVVGIQYLLKQDTERLEKLLPRLAERTSNIATTSIWLRKV